MELSSLKYEVASLREKIKELKEELQQMTHERDVLRNRIIEEKRKSIIGLNSLNKEERKKDNSLIILGNLVENHEGNEILIGKLYKLIISLEKGIPVDYDKILEGLEYNDKNQKIINGFQRLLVKNILISLNYPKINDGIERINWKNLIKNNKQILHLILHVIKKEQAQKLIYLLWEEKDVRGLILLICKFSDFINLLKKDSLIRMAQNYGTEEDLSELYKILKKINSDGNFSECERIFLTKEEAKFC